MKKIFTLIAVLTATLSMNATEIFRFQLADDAPNLEVAAQDQAEFGLGAVTTYTAFTITEGARLDIFNGHADKAANMIKNQQINLGNSGGSYVVVTLPSGVKLKKGDVIKLLNGSTKGGAVSFTDSKVSNDNMDDNNEYIVPEAGDGKDKFYIWRGGSKPAFSGVTVERNENQTIAPVISVVNGKVEMTSGTEGASIYYATETGVTPSTGTLYTAPIAITGSVTYYAVAIKDGMDVSKESSKAIEYYGIPADAIFAATLKAPSDIPSGSGDEALESLTDGTFTATKVESDAVLSNSAAWNDNVAFKGLVKVKKTITIATTGDKNIIGIKVKGISNADDNGQAVTAEGMKYTTDANILPARNIATEPGVVELLATEPAKEFKVYFSAQARVMFEIYVTDGTNIETVKNETINLNAPMYNLAGQKVAEGYKGVVIQNGRKVVK